MDSIRQHLTKDEMIAEIKMMLSADIVNKYQFLLVEGQDDITFFEGKTTNNVWIYESYSGKDGVYEIVNFFDIDSVIGICDRDYDKKAHKNIYYYDYANLEMMLLSNNKSFESFVNANYHGTLKCIKLRETIFDNLKFLSLLRKKSFENHLNICFRGLSFTECFKENTFNNSVLIKQISDRNKNLALNYRKLLIEIRNTCDDNIDINTYFSITQGHDFLCCFQLYCNQNRIRKKSVNIETLIISLISSYHFSYFKETNLYNSLVYRKIFKEKI